MTPTQLARGGALAALSLLAPSISAQVSLFAQDGPKAGARAGAAVARAGDVDRDGVRDYLVGEPGYALVSSFVPGRAVLYSGRTGQPIFTLLGLNHEEQFGASVAAGTDFDQDGWVDFFVGAPSYDSGRGRVALHSGRNGAVITQWQGLHQGSYFGTAITLVGFVDADSRADFAISAPNENVGGVTAQGRVRVYSGAGLGLLHQLTTSSEYANAGLGQALAGNCDWNGDGRSDLVVGAPLARRPYGSGFFHGMALVYSGYDGTVLHISYGVTGSMHGSSVAGLGNVHGDARGEIAVGAPLDGTAGAQAGRVSVHTQAMGGLPLYTLDGAPGSRFGSALSRMDDCDGAGTLGLLVGAPDHAGLLLGPIGRVTLHDAASGALLEAVAGSHLEGRFGAALAWLGDLNGDGVDDWVAGAPSADAAATNAGHSRVVLARAAQSATYCTAKWNSLGCLPSISASGAPSLSVGDNFHVRATNVRSSTPGIFLYSASAASQPFGGGTLCVGAPVVRGAVQGSGGTPGGVDCSGVYDHHFSRAALAATGFAAGTLVHCQFWSRDPGFPAPLNVGLTAGLRFEVLP